MAAPAQLQQLANKARLVLAPAPPGTARSQGFHLRDAVLGPFAAWTAQFEGYTPFMYTDNKGLVTTGIGNLIEPIGLALALPWKRPDGSRASQAEITDAWNKVKSAWPDIQSFQAASLTNLRLDKEGIAQLVNQRLRANDNHLARRFPSYARWPADAQLAVNSMSWAMGSGFDFPAFTKAVNGPTPDFNAAAAASHINEAGNPGIVPRNQANRLLFENAAKVQAGHGDPDVLYYLGEVLGTLRRHEGEIAVGAGAILVAALFGVGIYSIVKSK